MATEDLVRSARDLNRNVCGDFCDAAGKDNNYNKAFGVALALDIVVPIIVFLLVLGLGGGILLQSILDLSDVWLVALALGGLVLGVALLGIVIFLTFVLFREIGLFGLIPTAITIGLSVIPILNLLSFVASLVPWNIMAIVLHILIYGNLELSGGRLAEI
jgi:hypothetical protein